VAEFDKRFPNAPKPPAAQVPAPAPPPPAQGGGGGGGMPGEVHIMQLKATKHAMEKGGGQRRSSVSEDVEEVLDE